MTPVPRPASATLAERLGYAATDRILIVNCDDLGVSRVANRATLDAMTRGIATSATLMVPCPWAWEAARLTAGRDVGVHLTLTSEYPGYRWRGLTDGASLHDADGFLAATTAAALARVDPEEARAEGRAQIETALGWGVDVTHLDAHMNVFQARSDLFEVYLDLAAAFRLPVRMVSRDEAAAQGFRARERAAARDILFTDDIVWHWPRRTLDVLHEVVPRLAPGVTEIFAHPVEDGEELRGYDPAHADLRAHDALCLTDPAAGALLARHGVRRISHRALRALQRGG